MRRDIPNVIRRQFASRAQFSCEYCRFPGDISYQPHQVDHIVSQKHGGDSELANLAYACARCNGYKGPIVAALTSDGRSVRLFNPRRHRWREHFRLSGAVIESLTEEGEATVRVLRINDSRRVEERFVLQQAGAYPKI